MAVASVRMRNDRYIGGDGWLPGMESEVYPRAASHSLAVAVPFSISAGVQTKLHRARPIKSEHRLPTRSRSRETIPFASRFHRGSRGDGLCVDPG